MPKSTADKLETRRSSACQSWDWLLNAVQSWQSQSAPQLHTPDLCDDGEFVFFYYYLFGFMFFPPKTEISLTQKTDVKNRYFLVLQILFNTYIWAMVLVCYSHDFTYGTVTFHLRATNMLLDFLEEQ